jgi:hypothetical protein
MLQLGPLAFATPWMLTALLLLPGIWWLVRVSPPVPKRVRFPAIRLLMDIAREEETPAHTPLWLLALRILLAALVILALARPLWNPAKQVAGSGPLLIVLDDGWASASHWTERRNAFSGLMNEARRAGRSVLVAQTAPSAMPHGYNFESAYEARLRTDAIEPQPIPPDRLALLDKLEDAGNLPKGGVQTIWLSDGIDYGDAKAFTDRLKTITGDKGLQLVEPLPTARALGLLPPSNEQNEFKAKLIRSNSKGPFAGTVRGLGKDGEPVGEAGFYFNDGSLEAEAKFDLPLELKNRISRIDIAGEVSAGAVSLIDERWRRRTVGLVSGGSPEDAQPLLSDLYYLDRAIAPYAEIRRYTPNRGNKSEIVDLLSSPLSVLILADMGNLIASDHAALKNWVEQGGVLVRFAGPRLAAQQVADELLPVTLRMGGRTLGGALSWTNPQHLASFDENSPFFGLHVPEEVTVSRQVLAEPSPELVERSWARLADGTPLVTSAKRGNGLVVLFHVTANSDWTNLPLSGLYVDMLRRIIAMSQSISAVNEAGSTASSGTLSPVALLNGYGWLVPPPATATPIPVNGFDQMTVTPQHPPGFYGLADNPRAFNLLRDGATLSALGNFAGITSREIYAATGEVRLGRWAIGLATLLAIADSLAALYMLGLFDAQPIRRRLSRRFGRRVAGVAIGLVVVSYAPDLRAADGYANQAALETHLAYVITGDSEADAVSKAGLAGLSQILRQRTAMEVGVPMGVDMERDELAFFPVLYWPMTLSQSDLSQAALAKIDTYLKSGGLILFDTRDQARDMGAAEGAGSQTLRRLLGKLDLPALQPAPNDHVLTKSFYLLQDFPGRWTGGQLWVETGGSSGMSRANDGVSAIVVGSNDYAAAWARDASGRTLYRCTPGGELQREMADRFGVNLVMYALTGNYKADQVHVPALLERLGE